jgi:ferredoxin-like protein FixX
MSTEEQLVSTVKSNLDSDSFAVLQKELEKQDELELTVTALFCMSKVMREDTRMQITKLLKLGEHVQILEHLCAKIKKVIMDTKIGAFDCPKGCGEKIPEMTLEFHLKSCNMECGKHNEVTFE